MGDDLLFITILMCILKFTYVNNLFIFPTKNVEKQFLTLILTPFNRRFL